MDKQKIIRLTGIKNQDLIKSGIQMKLEFESTEQVEFENSRFNIINQQEQYFEEKRQTGKYRFYGKIDQVLNLNIDDNIKRKPTFSELDIDNNKWDVVLLKPTSKQFNYEKKGETLIKSKLENGREYEFDLSNGLPLFKTTPKTISGRVRMGFNSILGHNLVVDDIIKIVKDNPVIPVGNYRVLEINGNNFYINFLDTNTTLSQIINIRELDVSEIEFVTVERGSPLFLLSTDIYFKKVVNNLTCDYYLKELEVIDIFDSVHKAAFSTNIFNQKSVLFSDQTIHDFTATLNHRNEPLDEIYVGVIKKQDNSGTLSAIESNFENLIDFTEPYQGLETIHDIVVSNVRDSDELLNAISGGISTTNSNINISRVSRSNISGVTRNTSRVTLGRFKTGLHIGDIMKHSLCEYNPQDIIEREINYVNHTFKYREEVKFKYNPFHKVNIRKFSDYIEDSNNVELIPPYADFSEKYQTHRWKNILPVGFFEGDNGVDFPFLNGSLYVFTPIIFNLRCNNSIKYDKGSGADIVALSEQDVFDRLFNIDEEDKDFIVYTGNPNC